MAEQGLEQELLPGSGGLITQFVRSQEERQTSLFLGEAGKGESIC